MDKIYLTRGDLQDINTVLKNFPDVEQFCLTADTSSGIGAIIELEFETEINGVTGIFKAGIADESTW